MMWLVSLYLSHLTWFNWFVIRRGYIQSLHISTLFPENPLWRMAQVLGPVHQPKWKPGRSSQLLASASTVGWHWGNNPEIGVAPSCLPSVLATLLIPVPLSLISSLLCPQLPLKKLVYKNVVRKTGSSEVIFAISNS